jgi:hypothetical protein
MTRNWRLILTVLASAALWMLAPAARLSLDRMIGESASPPSLNAHAADMGPFGDDWSLRVGDSASGDASTDWSSCFPTTGTPAPSGAAVPAQSTPTTPGTALQATYRLCGAPDPQTRQSIEQLIGGRGFSARLASRPDGCADLTISVNPDQAARSTGSQSVSLSVGLGGSQTISIQIVSENGATRVTTGPGG